MARRAAFVAGVGLALAACSSGEVAEPAPTTTAQQSATTAATPTDSGEPTGPLKPRAVGDVLTGLSAPWSVAFLPDDTALISERDTGRIWHVEPDGSRWARAEVGRIGDLDTANEAGLMGLVAHPDGKSVYAMHTSGSDNRVVRMSWDGRDLGSPRPVLTGIRKNVYHDGGRLAFGPDGMLYVATGDAGVPESAQDRDGLNGKILRVTPTGDVPKDNPFPGSPVYSWGHRNVQGLAFDERGRLWASEFGEKTYDELNLIEPGGNYGWPVVEGPGGGDRFIDPQASWSPTAIASPSGIAVLDNSVWVATLRGETLYRVPIEGGRAGDPVALYDGEYGRLRDVVAAPDGSLWLMTNNTDTRGNPRDGDDRIIRIDFRAR